MGNFNQIEDHELFYKLRAAFKKITLSDELKIVLNTEYSNWATEYIPNASDEVFIMRANDWLIAETGLSLSEPSLPNPIWNNNEFIVIDGSKFTYWIVRNR